MTSEFKKSNGYKIMGAIKLYDANLVDLEYEWISETNACMQCLSLNGKVFKSFKDVHPHPHPNCKCKLEVRYNTRVESVTSKTEADKLVEENKNQLNAEIENIGEQIRMNLEPLKNLLNILNGNYFRLIKYKELINIEILREEEKNAIRKLEKEIQVNINEIENLINDCTLFLTNIKNNHIINIKQGLQLTDDIAVIIASKQTSLLYGFKHSKENNMPESYELFKIALNDKSSDAYIKKNGKIYNSINDLNNKYDKENIKKKVELESTASDCKVIIMNNDSSLAHKIAESAAIARFVQDNYVELVQGQTILSRNITFNNDDRDLYSSFHSAGIKNCKIDDFGNLRLQLVDFYNFNEGRTSVKGRVGRKLQEMDDIKPYYIIVDVIVPKNIIQQFPNFN